MGHGRSDKRDIQHSRKPDVGDILALAEQEPPVFLAREAGTDSLRARPDALVLHAATASGGRIEASESWRLPVRRQNAGRSMRSVRSFVSSLSRRVQLPRS